jgi:hypothetical protein
VADEVTNSGSDRPQLAPKAMVELWPRLQALAREPVRNEDDYIECRAFQGIAFDVQFLWSGIPARSRTKSLLAGMSISLCSFAKTAGPAILSKRTTRWQAASNGVAKSPAVLPRKSSAAEFRKLMVSFSNMQSGPVAEARD